MTAQTLAGGITGHPRTGAVPITPSVGYPVDKLAEVDEVLLGRPILGLAVRDIRSTIVLSVTGEVDIATSLDLSEALCNLVNEGARHLVCDLTGVSFLDASGLSALVICRRLAEAFGARLELVCLRASPTCRLIVLTGLDAAFVLHESLNGAVGSALVREC